MKIHLFALLPLFFITTATALAGSRAVTLDVQNMTCAVCPITVKKALERIPGVQHVSVDYTSKTATVQFDDAAAATNQLTEATKNAGYPSSVKTETK